MELFFLILLAAAAALLAWGLSRAVVTRGGARDRLAERLTGDGKIYRPAGEEERSIVIQATDVTALAKALARQSFFQKVQRQLSVVFPRASLSKFVAFAGVAGLLAGAFTVPLFDSMPVSLCVAAIVTYIPFFFLSTKFSKRNKIMSDQLPEALDFLARILRAGHSLSTGLQMMGTELPEPLAAEFRRCYDQHSLGQPLEDCLRDMATRFDSTEFAFFVTAVLIQRQTGGDLAVVLGNISGTIRSRMRLAGFLRAKTAEGRFTGYILVGFPMLMFAVAYSLNPGYAGKLLHTDTGQKLLATAIALQIIGLVAIRKLTTVRV
jgi:tight adherence protein B